MQRQLFKLATVLLVYANVIMCANQKDAFRSHLRKLIMSPCSTPQPRVIELEEILDGERLSKIGEYRHLISPPVTVLNRCFCTGYCANKNHSCIATEMEKITLTFAILYQESPTEYFEVNTVSHTKCTCDTP